MRRYPSTGQVHLADFVELCQGGLAILVGQTIDVDGSIGRLSGHKFIEGVPCHALDIVVVLGDLAYQRTCHAPLAQPRNTGPGAVSLTSSSIVYPRDVIHAPNDEV